MYNNWLRDPSTVHAVSGGRSRLESTQNVLWVINYNQGILLLCCSSPGTRISETIHIQRRLHWRPQPKDMSHYRNTVEEPLPNSASPIRRPSTSVLSTTIWTCRQSFAVIRYDQLEGLCGPSWWCTLLIMDFWEGFIAACMNMKVFWSGVLRN